MTKNSFTSVKPGDNIYVYVHSSRRIKKAKIISITGRAYSFITGHFGALDIEFFFLTHENYTKLTSETSIHTFYINLDEEKNKRGSVYTGFTTWEDAKEFSNLKVENEINQKKEEIKRLETQIKNLNNDQK